jgi:hypothetical protein
MRKIELGEGRFSAFQANGCSFGAEKKAGICTVQIILQLISLSPTGC